MAYTQQIRILEQKLEQLSKGPFDKENVEKTLDIQSQLRRIKRLEWEENYERIKMDEDR
jgi:NADH:ubiquinone oxidoreductase subunit D